MSQPTDPTQQIPAATAPPESPQFSRDYGIQTNQPTDYSQNPTQQQQQSPVEPGVPYYQTPAQYYQQPPSGVYGEQPPPGAYAQQQPPPVYVQQPQAVYTNAAPLPPGKGATETTAFVGYLDEESGVAYVRVSYAWYTSTERNVYIAKVLGVLCAQLALTIFISALFLVFLDDGSAIPLWSILLVFFAMLLLIFGMRCVRNRFPLNYICLFLFTVLMSFLVGLIVLAYTLPSVLNALFVTLIVTFGLIAYVIITKEDFTLSGMSIAIMAFWSIFWWALFLFLFYPLLYDSPGVYNIIFSLLGIMLFMGLLMFDISRIVHHQFDIEEDYSVIAGAMNLYLDIINLFLCFLSLFGGKK
eukprot:CAMPEP_0201488912 /NCGR_PEP_ID=MMETSP0151_2-20130828/20256_1 /ASSEMBLY_ACC=CAM_ASM_000257 /TAXON_ID=200890 /ORGANISM="Paramoeba atlantica, Strain 621/1 / CCAP 1560/9" /LENGTH=355 /DNA_ID=CAMNT_0047874329 /DNA_START=6 /DNA_END=1073 /DNA_ORIENTATION=+